MTMLSHNYLHCFSALADIISSIITIKEEGFATDSASVNVQYVDSQHPTTVLPHTTRFQPSCDCVCLFCLESLDPFHNTENVICESVGCR